MTPTVHILATCRNLDLRWATTKVFETIRIGFPTARIIVRDNDLPLSVSKHIAALADKHDMEMSVHHSSTNHPDYVEGLIIDGHNPFVLCDTDMIFYNSVEDWKFDTALAGYYLPRYYNHFLNAYVEPKLHTSLLFINPAMIRKETRELHTSMAHTLPLAGLVPLINMIKPVLLPGIPQHTFYDICALLYKYLGGCSFENEQKNAYFHFHAGTWLDLILPFLPSSNEETNMREYIRNNHELGKGAWKRQDQYFAYHAKRIP